MAPVTSRKTKPSKKRVGRRRRARIPRAMSMAKYNPQPVFTETFRLGTPGSPGYVMAPNIGGQLQVSMSAIPQLSQYTNLYTKYRILKAEYLCLATYNTESSDLNAAAYNVGGGIAATGQGRIVLAIQSSPYASGPINEDSVLTCNGARIITAGPKFKVSHLPVPNMVDAAGNEVTKPKKQWLNFVPTGTQQVHGSVNWWYTLPATTVSLSPFYAVYCKLTFQLADPR